MKKVIKKVAAKKPLKKYQGQSGSSSVNQRGPLRETTYTVDAAPLREGYKTPQQWVYTWNPNTSSYDRRLKPAERDPKPKKFIKPAPPKKQISLPPLKKGGVTKTTVKKIMVKSKKK